LREGYVFPERGAQAAEALEKALAENAYGGVTDRAQFAMQLMEAHQFESVQELRARRSVYRLPGPSVMFMVRQRS
jgi:hypothetical protein